MAATFLTTDWMQAITEGVNADPGFTSAIATVDLTLQFHVTDTPSRGQVDYFLQIEAGSALLAPGVNDDADISVTNNYETAKAISKGELDTQMAFMQGKLVVKGDMAKLMMNVGALTQFAKAASTVPVDYPE